MSPRIRGGQVPPVPTSVAGPTRRVVGECHLVRGRSLLLIWERLLGDVCEPGVNQVITRGYLTKRGTDR